MKTLTEIMHRTGLCTGGRTVFREAVRGIVVKDRHVLMIYSTQNGDYKFPGGGIQRGESHEDALIREVREECGAMVSAIQGEFGKVIEYDAPIEPNYDVFRMDSLYYRCQVDDFLCQQTLDPYEQDLGFTPVWVDIDTAIRTNQAVLADDHRRAPRWTIRDLFVLEQVRERICDGSDCRAERDK